MNTTSSMPAPQSGAPSMADWWARHTDDESDASTNDAGPLRSVEDLVDAFRTALQHTEAVESAVDLCDLGSPPASTGDDAGSDLDYFAPAFRRVLGSAGAPNAEASSHPRSGADKQEEATPTLDYFAPAFHDALGEPSKARGPETLAGSLDEASDRDAASDAPAASDDSLDYFAPAFRTALGATSRSSNSSTHPPSEEAHDAADPSRELPLSAPCISVPFRMGFNLGRFAERCSGAASHNLVAGTGT